MDDSARREDAAGLGLSDRSSSSDASSDGLDVDVDGAVGALEQMGVEDMRSLVALLAERDPASARRLLGGAVEAQAAVLSEYAMPQKVHAALLGVISPLFMFAPTWSVQKLLLVPRRNVHDVRLCGVLLGSLAIFYYCAYKLGAASPFVTKASIASRIFAGVSILYLLKKGHLEKPLAVAAVGDLLSACWAISKLWKLRA